MRRYVFILLVFVVLVTPFILQRVLGRGAQHQAAADAAHTIIVITAHNEGIRREFRDAFVAWHRQKYGGAVDVDYRALGGSDIVKQFQDYDRSGSAFNTDVVWGGGDFLFNVQLKFDLKGRKPGYLEAVVLPAYVIHAAFPKADLGGVALYDMDKPPAWFGAALSSFGILYNKDVLAYLKLPEPKTWRDLADPRYAGWVIAADPTRSASTKTAFMIIVERAMADAKEQGRGEDEGWRDGMGLVRIIGANARMFVGSSEAVPGVVAGGDGGAGMCIDFYGRSQVDAIGERRLGYVEPAGATAINPDPIALVKGAPHHELAIRFIEFVLSEQGQRLWNLKPGTPGGPRETALRRLPIMPSVYGDNANFTDKVNPYQQAAAFNTSTARKGTFPILGELIEFSCMDLLDELRATRQAILASTKAAELDARLARFPFDQKEALARGKRWKEAPPGEKLKLQREWTREFREEYRKLREEAGQP